MDNVHAFDPNEVVNQSPAQYYEILFDTGKEVLQWNGEGFSAVAGKINFQMQLTHEGVVEAYQKALENARTLSKRGILHIVPVNN